MIFTILITSLFFSTAYGQSTDFSDRYSVVHKQSLQGENRCQEELKVFVAENIPGFSVINACSHVSGRGIQLNIVADGEHIIQTFTNATEDLCYQTLAEHIEIFTHFTSRYKLFRNCSWVSGEGNRLLIFQVNKQDQ